MSCQSVKEPDGSSFSDVCSHALDTAVLPASWPLPQMKNGIVWAASLKEQSPLTSWGLSSKPPDQYNCDVWASSQLFLVFHF